MARNVNSFRLGLFVVICGAIGLTAVVWLGASRIFEKTKTYVSYFNESVKGLQQDAVVNYRGVGVGRVAAIELAPDGRLIEVKMYLKPAFQVTEGMAIQLREQGITGMRYLEIDKAPSDLEKLTPHLDFTPPHPLIPSYPSELAQLKYALQTIYDQISSLNLKNLTDSWTETARLINAVLDQFKVAFRAEDWRETLGAIKSTAQDAATFMDRLAAASSERGMKQGFEDLTATLKAARLASESLSAQLHALPPDSLASMAKGWNETLTSGGKTFASLNQDLGASAALVQQSLNELKLVLDQLNGLVQTLKDQPNRILLSPEQPDPFKRR